MQKVEFGTKLKDLTPLQESVLTILYLSEKLANYPSAGDNTFWASGRFFLLLNGVIFESYHRKLMRELAELGWISILTLGGTLYYGLTDVGFLYKTEQETKAREAALYTDIPF